LLTDVPSAEIAARRRAVESGSENPRDAKADLARRITAQFYGESSAVRTEEDFRRAFARGQEPETIETVEVSPEAGALGHVLVAAKLCASMREARRKIAEGAVAIFESGEPRLLKNPDERLPLSGSVTLRVGRRFRRIVWKS